MTVEMATLDRVDSLAERAYRALREQIATGGLAPGERVTERGLGLQLGVSATPIREALRRLEQERLVERVAARQLRIAAHSDQALRELMYTEAVLRAAAARIATPKISDDTNPRSAAGPAGDRRDGLRDRPATNGSPSIDTRPAGS